MKCGVSAIPALILAISGQLICGNAYAFVTNRAIAKITQRPIPTQGLLQIAKHDEGDSDEQDENEHHRRYGHQYLFCGPYFTASSAPYFRDYYSRDDYANLPPGLRKHVLKTGHLPPGLEKKYQRTGQLPPGLRKRFNCGQMLPAEYSPYLYPVPEVAYQKVGPLPPDSNLYLYGQDLILLNDHTKAIIDILRGAY